MPANNPAPWASDSLSYASGPVVEHTWDVQIYNRATGAMVTVAAWDVVVSLDATRSPLGHAEFKTLAAPGITTDDAPYYITPVQIQAGWKRTTGDDLHPIFGGLITASEEQDGILAWTADTAEVLYEVPSTVTKTIGDSDTGLSQAINAWNAAAVTSAQFFDVNLVTSDMNTPTSAQLANYRALSLTKNDVFMDFLRLGATTLGQWIRADYRDANPPKLNLSAEPTWNTAYKLTTSLPVVKNVTRQGRGQWANVVQAQVVSSASTKTTTVQSLATAIGAGAAGGIPPAFRGSSPTAGTRVSAVKPIEVYATAVNTSAGATYAGDEITGNPSINSGSPVYKWAVRLNSWSRKLRTTTLRALWWVQPYDIVEMASIGVTTYVGTVTFDVDNGLMTITGYNPST